MAESNAKEKLVDFLDRKVFRPILDTSPDRFSGRDRELLDEVKGATRRTRERYREEYGSAEKVYQMFHDDLSSEPAQEVSRESRRLDLPTFEDVEDEFNRLAREVGIRDHESR